MIKIETKNIKGEDKETYVGIHVDTDKDDITEYVAVFIHIAKILNEKYDKNKDELKDIIEKFM